jgi:hypothetical protein
VKKPADEMRAEIFLMLTELEDDAVEVLHMQATRMVAGRKHYGDLVLDTDRRDWLAEALQEHLDASNYYSAALIKLRRERG